VSIGGKSIGIERQDYMEKLNYGLFERYKSETGKEAIYNKQGATFHTLDYVNWLESRVIRLELKGKHESE
jgi:hypothetical protein